MRFTFLLAALGLCVFGAAGVADGEAGSAVLPRDHYQAFLGILIDLIVELRGLIIKPFDNQIQS
jgi:hypothetical protein